MIPKFPEFKKIEISDRKEIEEYTNKFPPYSDFNFTSLWSWDTNEERMVSVLNDNLVVRFTDYETCKPFFSFIGENKLEETAKELINFAKSSGIFPILNLIPKEIAQKINDPDLSIEEDRNNFDYIFNISDLANLKGVKFKAERHAAKKFEKENQTISFEVHELNNNEIEKDITPLFHRWVNKKKLDKETYNFEHKHEEKAISRILQTVAEHRLILSCIRLNGLLIGFSFDEILSSGFVLSHFTKADINYGGIYEFLNKKIAEYLLTQKNMNQWNWEQDLGLESLRTSKMNYHPTNFLKKYKISLTSPK